MTLTERKIAIRAEAKIRRAAAHGIVDPAPALAALGALLAEFAGQVVAGYSPIGTEIDPLPRRRRTARPPPR
ncbi:hypothetical protein [Mangrovicoccus ximenensis]|uniref:hypothetical protein n=1 Tax=Mangrovicoccus ximenensis TaxID=1911570 RepID=UPI00191C32CA|nr:hypothetical protein [Mangrovicoccus ximenensis]